MCEREREGEGERECVCERGGEIERECMCVIQYIYVILCCLLAKLVKRGVPTLPGRDTALYKSTLLLLLLLLLFNSNGWCDWWVLQDGRPLGLPAWGHSGVG